MKLYRSIGHARAKAASARAVEIDGLTRESIASLITTYKAAKPSAEPATVVEHANLRGPGYFH